jgi:hypothetical protein
MGKIHAKVGQTTVGAARKGTKFRKHKKMGTARKKLVG